MHLWHLKSYNSFIPVSEGLAMVQKSFVSFFSARAARTSLMVCTMAAATSILSGCFPVAATGVVVGALSVADRRTTGAQADDQSIELKAFNRFRDQFKSDRVSLSVVSYNRIVLLTGYVPDEATKAEAARSAGKIDNVRSVINEVMVGPPASIRAYGSDSVLTARIKASLLEAKDLQANTIKVYTEGNTAYLMGIVTEREANRATDIASRVSGVRRVVRAFEVISEAELSRMQLQTGGMSNKPESSAPASGPGAAAETTPGVRPLGGGAEVTPIR